MLGAEMPRLHKAQGLLSHPHGWRVVNVTGQVSFRLAMPHAVSEPSTTAAKDAPHSQHGRLGRGQRSPVHSTALHHRGVLQLEGAGQAGAATDGGDLVDRDPHPGGGVLAVDEPLGRDGIDLGGGLSY